ncbi:L,D-transpeptidase family protein [Sphingomonas turrisvirgatae]|uniref:L,D-transpeptidase family protein n=1 Tax=Sphingomonas turrisvirgatae TaxID=1888892 RepID=UPI0008469195|nr:L,D-transpeptidase family protein [Sphingomonas turrisvirgatae]
MGLALAGALWVGGVGVALLAAAPAASQPIAATAAQELLLRTGQWTWLEDAAYQRTGNATDVSILISLPGQIAYVYRGGVLIAASTVSTGKPGKRTPVGEFTILQKREFHRSNLYSNAPMPFMQRLTWTGIALHAGVLPGYPASHGCIRFPREFARRLFEVTQLGGIVSVVDYEIDDPRVRRGAPRLEPQQVAAAPMLAAPFLRADPAAFQTGAFDVVTASNDVVIPVADMRNVVSDAVVPYAPLRLR